MKSRRRGRTSVRSDEGSTERQSWPGILAGIPLWVMAVIAVSCGVSSKSTTPETATTASPSAAPSNTVWLCRPGLTDNPCEGDYDHRGVLRRHEHHRVGGSGTGPAGRLLLRIPDGQRPADPERRPDD